VWIKKKRLSVGWDECDSKVDKKSATEIFEDISVEFDFEDEANIDPVFLSNFNLDQYNSVEQILSLLQQRNKLIVRI